MPESLFESTSFKLNGMLSITKFELELISDDNMYLFFEKAMIDGFFYISKISSKASNKCLKYFDPKQESKHVIYLDANNLYGYAISKFLEQVDSNG